MFYICIYVRISQCDKLKTCIALPFNFFVYIIIYWLKGLPHLLMYHTIFFFYKWQQIRGKLKFEPTFFIYFSPFDYSTTGLFGWIIVLCNDKKMSPVKELKRNKRYWKLRCIFNLDRSYVCKNYFFSDNFENLRKKN